MIKLHFTQTEFKYINYISKCRKIWYDDYDIYEKGSYLVINICRIYDYVIQIKNERTQEHTSEGCE